MCVRRMAETNILVPAHCTLHFAGTTGIAPSWHGLGPTMDLALDLARSLTTRQIMAAHDNTTCRYARSMCVRRMAGVNILAVTTNGLCQCSASAPCTLSLPHARLWLPMIRRYVQMHVGSMCVQERAGASIQLLQGYIMCTTSQPETTASG